MKPKEIILQPKISYIAIGYTKPIVTDDPINKIVTAKINMITADKQQFDYPLVTIWSGDDYDNAGQWTDSDIDKRLIEIIES